MYFDNTVEKDSAPK
jgi:hypothetical protein